MTRMLHELLRKYEYELLKCVYCGQCRYGCPTLSRIGWESSAPRGKVKLALAYAKGEIPFTEGLLDTIYSCSTCRKCNIECPAGLDVSEIIIAMRGELVSGKLAPPSSHLKNVESIRAHSNPYGQSREQRAAWAQGVLAKGNSDEIYFAGCTPSIKTPEIATSSTAILSTSGISPLLMREKENCCAGFLLRIGCRSDFERIAQENVEKLKGRRLIVSCAGCYKTFKGDYREAGIGEMDVAHLTHVLSDAIDNGRLRPNRSIGTTVTYHDPCHLGRHCSVYEPPRNVISKLRGVKLVEMKNSKQQARCCGAGGGLKSAFPRMALDIGEDRIREAEDTGASILVSACPFCKINLRDAAQRAGSSLEVLDISELVHRAI